MLLAHDWPGNVREMQNAAERFALGLELAISAPLQPLANNQGLPLPQQVEAFERALIAAELARGHASLRSVAEALQVPRKTLHDKIRKYGLGESPSGGNPPG